MSQSRHRTWNDAVLASTCCWLLRMGNASMNDRYENHRWLREKNWTDYPRTANGELGCPYCSGTGRNVCPPFPPPHPYPGHDHPCMWCEGTGSLVMYLLDRLEAEKRGNANLEDKLKDIFNWIKDTSKCSTCQGDRMKTPGGIPCKECSLIGNLPWGG